MKKEVGHNFLAKLGKKRLRPGGTAATDWLIRQVQLGQDTQVLEVACNMCTTAIQLASQYRCRITGVDMDARALDKARQRIEAAGLADYITVQQANALKLPFADESFDLVINEAMLTMLNQNAKEKAVAEYCRVLKPGGILLTHDITYVKADLAEQLEELRRTIHVQVEPLQVQRWESLFHHAGFAQVTHHAGPMSLMSIRGMMRDEGLLGTLRVIRNGLRSENRQQFQQMFRFFNGPGRDLSYIAVCSRKQKAGAS